MSAFNPYYIFLQLDSQYFDSALVPQVPGSPKEREANIAILGNALRWSDRANIATFSAAASALPLEPRRPSLLP